MQPRAQFSLRAVDRRKFPRSSLGAGLEAVFTDLISSKSNAHGNSRVCSVSMPATKIARSETEILLTFLTAHYTLKTLCKATRAGDANTRLYTRPRAHLHSKCKCKHRCAREYKAVFSDLTSIFVLTAPSALLRMLPNTEPGLYYSRRKHTWRTEQRRRTNAFRATEMRHKRENVRVRTRRQHRAVRFLLRVDHMREMDAALGRISTASNDVRCRRSVIRHRRAAVLVLGTPGLWRSDASAATTTAY